MPREPEDGGTVDIGHLEIEATWAALRHLAARNDLTISRDGDTPDGFRAVLEDEDEEGVFFAQLSLAGHYLSLSLVLVVDEGFLEGNMEKVLAVTSEFETSSRVERDDRLEPGEVYYALSLRLFLPGFCDETFALALSNLRAAREALAIPKADLTYSLTARTAGIGLFFRAVTRRSAAESN